MLRDWYNLFIYELTSWDIIIYCIDSHNVFRQSRATLSKYMYIIAINAHTDRLTDSNN